MTEYLHTISGRDLINHLKHDPTILDMIKVTFVQLGKTEGVTVNIEKIYLQRFKIYGGDDVIERWNLDNLVFELGIIHNQFTDEEFNEFVKFFVDHYLKDVKPILKTSFEIDDITIVKFIDQYIHEPSGIMKGLMNRVAERYNAYGEIVEYFRAALNKCENITPLSVRAIDVINRYAIDMSVKQLPHGRAYREFMFECGGHIFTYWCVANSNGETQLYTHVFLTRIYYKQPELLKLNSKNNDLYMQLIKIAGANESAIECLSKGLIEAIPFKPW